MLSTKAWKFLVSEWKVSKRKNTNLINYLFEIYEFSKQAFKMGLKRFLKTTWLISWSTCHWSIIDKLSFRYPRPQILTKWFLTSILQMWTNCLAPWSPDSSPANDCRNSPHSNYVKLSEDKQTCQEFGRRQNKICNVALN